MILVELMKDVAPELCLFIILVFDNDMTSNSLRGPYADSTEECYGELQNFSGLFKCCSLLCDKFNFLEFSSWKGCYLAPPLSGLVCFFQPPLKYGP